MNASKALLSLISATSRHDLDGMEKALAQEADPNGLSGSGTTALGMLARENTRDTTQGAMAMLIQPVANSIGVSKVIEPFHMVAIQQKNNTASGREIAIELYMK